MSISDRIRVKDVRLLSDHYGTLKTTTFDWRRADGEWQTQSRETYDRGGAATVLPYNLAQRMVILIKQFRYPVYVGGRDELMIEAFYPADAETKRALTAGETAATTSARTGED